MPGFAFPASLTKIELRSRIEAVLLSLVPAGLSELVLWGCEVEGPAEGPSSLLASMAHLQQLTTLTLYVLGDLNWPPLGPAYSALAASSCLRSVCLLHCKPPAGVWEYVFPASRKLPHLLHLEISDDGEMPPAPAPTWGAGGLSSLVSACPNLRHLKGPTLQHELHVSEVHKLTALTHLEGGFVSGSRWRHKGCLHVVKGLTAMPQLRHLEFGWHEGSLEVDPLQPLTSLTALTYLSAIVTISDATAFGDNRFYGTQQVRTQTSSWMLSRTCRPQHSKHTLHAVASCGGIWKLGGMWQLGSPCCLCAPACNVDPPP